MRKLILYTTAFLLLALLIVPAAMAAELHIVSTAPGVIDVYAEGSISNEVTAGNPATATISVDGAAATTYNFWASRDANGISGNSMDTSIHYTITASSGDHKIKVDITNPNKNGAKLAYNGLSTITVPAPSTPIPTPTPTPDTTPPFVTAPSDVTAEGNILGGWSGVIGTATATDNADPSPKVTNDAPALFPLGVTTVTWTATDATGNKASATQTVTVKDTTPPTVTTPAGVTVEGNVIGGYSGSVGSATATDIVDASPKVTNDAPALFPLGLTTVTWTATDATGNKASATQTVTVKDTTPPTVTAPAGVTVEGNTIGGYSGSVGSATATDIVDASPKVTNDGPVLFPLGVTIVTWTATDATGNKASATQTVTVKDTTPPTVTTPAGVTVEGNVIGGYSGSVGSATATDIVDASPKVTNDAPALFPLGVTTVTWIATDATGNKASATQTVTVKDTTPPTVTAPATLTVLVNAPKSLLTGSAKDIVDANPLLKNDAPSVFPAGITTVTWTATDATGNKGTATTLVTANYNIVGSGFLTPINMDGSNMLQLNSALPVKFQLTDYTGKYISTAVANLYTAKISGTTVGQYAPAISKGASNTGSLFRYDTTGNQYIFNLDTKTLSTGNYQIKAVLDSGQTIKVTITFK